MLPAYIGAHEGCQKTERNLQQYAKQILQHFCIAFLTLKFAYSIHHSGISTGVSLEGGVMYSLTGLLFWFIDKNNICGGIIGQ